MQADWDREHRFPDELYPKLAELGLMGVCVPEEYGGAGADFLSYVLVLEELSRADAGVGVTVAVHTSAVDACRFSRSVPTSSAPASCRRSPAGEQLGAFALTEPGSGSDAGSLRTTASAGRRRLGAERLEAVDHERIARGHVPALRTHRPGDGGRARCLLLRARRRARARDT